MVLTVLAVALALRVAWFLEFRTLPWYDHLVVDAELYDAAGWRIAQGEWLWDEVFDQDPLYAYFVGALYALFGHVPLVVYLAQMLLGCATCVLTARLAERCFAASPHRRAVAWIAGLGCALATPLVFYETLLLKTSLGVFLSVVHLLALVSVVEAFRMRVTRHGAGLGLGAGMLLGLNVLTRGNYLLLAPLFAFWVAWRLIGAARTAACNTSTPGRPLRTRYGPGTAAVLLYTLGSLLVVLPVTARNYALTGELVPVTAHGGINLYIGNNPTNRTGFYDVPPGVRAEPKLQLEDLKALAERETGRSLTLAEMDRHYLGKSLDWVASNPGDAAALYLRKWGLWLAGMEPSNNYSFDFVRENFSAVLDLPIVNAYTFGVLGWATVLLVLLRWRAREGLLAMKAQPGLGLLVLYVLAYSVTVTLFFVLARYRAPIYPVLIILSAASIVSLATGFRRSARIDRASALPAVLLVGLAVWRPVWQPGWWSFGRIVEGTQHYNTALIYLEKRQPRLALTSLRRAMDLLGDNHRDVLVHTADIYLRLGLAAEAVEVLERLVRKNPDDRDAWRRLALALEASNDPVRAAEAAARAAGGS